jgi:hypothetical protein
MRPKVAALAVAITAALTALAALAQAAPQLIPHGVPAANARAGHPPDVVAAPWHLKRLAEGADALENPSGIFDSFGFLADGAPPHLEATKTEPDENTYLILRHPGGPTPGYDYGRHFLFQGHEAGGGHAYLTRINLDVKDPAHRITLLSPGDGASTGFSSIDGSIWDPFAQQLIFTQENGANGGALAQSPYWGSSTPPPVTTLDGSFGKGGFEGVKVDDHGDVLVVEDAGGQTVPVDPSDPSSAKAAKQPNSFVYRFVPDHPDDLTHGKLQVLRVTVDGHPVTFTCTPGPTSCPASAAQASADVFSNDQLRLHSGDAFPVTWVTIHDTATDGTAPFDANQAAKGINAHGPDAKGTPFKRPENAAFQPGSDFRTFYFVPTGDTDARSGNVPALAQRGAWGSIFRVQLDASRTTGTINRYALGDAAHASFDNVTFLDRDTLLTAEDRGDSLHTQLDTLDSIWAWNVGEAPSTAQRFVALGRDPASETDASIAALPCLATSACGFTFQNEGDNEPTGLIASDGDASVAGLLDAHVPAPGRRRVFFTQQHGENQVWEALLGSRRHDADR